MSNQYVKRSRIMPSGSHGECELISATKRHARKWVCAYLGSAATICVFSEGSSLLSSLASLSPVCMLTRTWHPGGIAWSAPTGCHSLVASKFLDMVAGNPTKERKLRCDL